MGRGEAVRAVAARSGLTEAAMAILWDALERGGGRMAQFSHPDLGGMGQWSGSGMLQIGAMFDQALKARVAAACADLSGSFGAEEDDGRSSRGEPGGTRPPHGPAAAAMRSAGDWWPGDFGRLSASGAQNGIRYAYFDGARRLAVDRDGDVTLYDTGRHRIFGVSQLQGPGSNSNLAFAADDGTVRLGDLAVAGRHRS